jgi:MSHA biogenesis protein MshK
LANAPEAGDSTSGGPRLQSVLLPENGRPVAVISGKTVALGESIDGAKLVGLNEQGAVLRGPEGVTYLYLAPDVEKNMLDRSRSGPGSKAGRKKELP